MPETYLNQTYLERVQKAGTPPSNISELATKSEYMDLFVTFAENQDNAEELKLYTSVVNDLVVLGLDAEKVWEQVQETWDQQNESLNELLEKDDLKKQLLQDSFAKLGDTYQKMFLPVTEKILNGGFDEKADEQNEIDEDPGDQIELLLKEIAVEVKEKNIEVDHFIKSLNTNSFTTNEDALEKELVLLSNADLSNKATLKDLRRESVIDEKDFELLLTELKEVNELDGEEQSVQELLADLLDFKNEIGQKEIVEYIDSLEDVPLDQKQLEELLNWADEYSNSTTEQTKNLKVKEIVQNSTAEKDQFELLLNEVEKMCQVDVDYVQELDNLLNELAEEAPGNQISENFLNSMIPEDLKIKGDRNSLFENLMKLGQANERESQLIRKRVSTILDKNELDQLLQDLKSSGDEEVNAGGDAPTPPKPKLEAVKIVDWDPKVVIPKNYAALSDAPAGAMVAVLAAAGVALLGSEWATDPALAPYVNGFAKVFADEIDYPASGKVERGAAVVEKGSGLFNAGTVTVSGISAENQDAVITAISAKSKKKIKFV